VLRPFVGHDFEGIVVDVGEDRALVQLRDPAVVAWARTARRCRPGTEVTVRLHTADPVERRLELTVR
jgi:threonine dehydrogenase-like Zn-dependent dehydrogenase